ncbi:MAG: hypothetical protein K6U74_02725 [Firmicutes bacterium]|nr:hypothetical protein [Bacillota bacterium]
MLKARKYIVSMLIALFVLTGTRYSYAGGVPVYQYSSTFSYGPVVVGFDGDQSYGDYDWTASGMYYEIIGYSNMLSLPYFYSGSTNFEFGLSAQKSGGLLVQGFNESGWVDIYWTGILDCPTNSPYYRSYSIGLNGNYRQIRFIGVSPNIWYRYFEIRNGVVNVYLLGADQDTAVNAYNAAQGIGYLRISNYDPSIRWNGLKRVDAPSNAGVSYYTKIRYRTGYLDSGNVAIWSHWLGSVDVSADIILSKSSEWKDVTIWQTCPAGATSRSFWIGFDLANQNAVIDVEYIEFGSSNNIIFSDNFAYGNYGAWTIPNGVATSFGTTSVGTIGTLAQTAATNAADAKTSADTAASRVWDLSESKSAATLAKESRNYAQTAVNNTSYNSQSAAYWAYLSAQNAAPVINKVQGQNGATCTSGSSFTVVISATPSSGVSYRVTCGTFDSGWTVSNTVTVNSGIVSGANTATVQVKNAAGTTAQTTFTFFKI